MIKFLIVRFSSIGDIILTTPVIRHLKQQVEESEIHYLTKSDFTSILEANPYVDHVHSLNGNMSAIIKELKIVGIDYIIDLHRNTRSARIKFGLKRMDFSVNKLNIKKWLYVNLKINRLPDLHLVDRNLDTIRSFISGKDERGLDYFIPDEYRVPLSSLPPEYQKGYIGLAVGAQHQTKKLPVESLIELCSKLSFPVIILGSEADINTGNVIKRNLPGKNILNTSGMYNIHQSASLVKQATLLITHDTGLMHIGAAFKKKIISVWGNTVPAFGMYPYNADPLSAVFEVPDLKCRPCSKIGYQKCPKKHFRCMIDQDISGIARTANRLLQVTAQ